jgi:CheY-like chemotaxis protein
MRVVKERVLLANVLVVEDNPSIGLVIELALTDEGHHVELRQNALDGLSIMQNAPVPDLVLTNLRLPGMNGRDFVLKMRSDHRLQGVPVVIITGSIPETNILPNADLYQGLLLKPFDLDDLTDTVLRLTS